MSTTYMLQRPLKPATILRRTGWRVIQTSDPDYKKGEPYSVLTNGESFAHPDIDDQGRIWGFERYGGNRVDSLADGLNAVSEHDYEHPRYVELFGDPNAEDDCADDNPQQATSVL